MTDDVAHMSARPIIGATTAELLARCPVCLVDQVTFADIEDNPTGLVTGVLTAALAGVRRAAPCEVPLLLAAHDYCVDMATVFVRRCDQPERRLRPSDSIRLETSELLRHFATATGWRGAAQILVGPSAAEQVAFLASALVPCLHPAVVACELHADGVPVQGAPFANPTAPYLVVAQVLEDVVDDQPQPAPTRIGDPYLRSTLVRRLRADQRTDVSTARSRS